MGDPVQPLFEFSFIYGAFAESVPEVPHPADLGYLSFNELVAVVKLLQRDDLIHQDLGNFQRIIIIEGFRISEEIKERIDQHFDFDSPFDPMIDVERHNRQSKRKEDRVTRHGLGSSVAFHVVHCQDHTLSVSTCELTSKLSHFCGDLPWAEHLNDLGIRLKGLNRSDLLNRLSCMDA